MIISDSTTSKININHIKDNINTSEETVIFKRFPGHTAEEIAFYVPKPLSDIKPNQVIIVAGTNSLTRAIYQQGTINEYDIVESIMKIGRAAKQVGAKKIYVSGLLVRRGQHYRNAITAVNELLYMACIAENFIFMDQEDITLAHISTDGVHPNFYGSTLLKMKLLSVLSTFDRDLMSFKDIYEKSLF